MLPSRRFKLSYVRGLVVILLGMLPEIAAEALHFLSRRDLDKTCAVNKWLDALIAHCCDVLPLRLVARVTLYPRGRRHVVMIEEHLGTVSDNCSFRGRDEDMHFCGSVLHHSYVDFLQVS